MSALAPASVVDEGNPGELKFLDFTLKLCLPLPWGAVGRVEVRQGFFFDPEWGLYDNRNRVTLLLDFAF